MANSFSIVLSSFSFSFRLIPRNSLSIFGFTMSPGPMHPVLVLFIAAAAIGAFIARSLDLCLNVFLFSSISDFGDKLSSWYSFCHVAVRDAPPCEYPLFVNCSIAFLCVSSAIVFVFVRAIWFSNFAIFSSFSFSFLYFLSSQYPIASF